VTIIDHPSPNHSARKPGVRVDTVVLHHTGPGPNALGWLCDSESKASAHYLIDVKGRVFRLVAETRKAWHAGISAMPWEQAKATKKDSVNDRSVGIEIDNPGDGVTPFTEAQYQALAQLLPDIVRRLGTHVSFWPLGDVLTAKRVRQPKPGEEQGVVHILGHRDVAPGRKTDPADNFDWGRVREMLTGVVA
jgi:N-acetylmuramoyl-L-alanine amidase